PPPTTSQVRGGGVPSFGPQTWTTTSTSRKGPLGSPLSRLAYRATPAATIAAVSTTAMPRSLSVRRMAAVWQVATRLRRGACHRDFLRRDAATAGRTHGGDPRVHLCYHCPRLLQS